MYSSIKSMADQQPYTITEQTVTSFSAEINTYQDVNNLLNSLTEANASSAFDILMVAILVFSPSDMHIDATSEGARIRIRIDSMLYEVARINARLYRLILYRIRLISGLKINIADAQDGRFSLQQPDRDIEFRVSVIPSEYGGDIALRVLDPQSLISLEQLGMRSDALEFLTTQLKRPYGLFIVTGPTGAGKTTTLYAIIKFLQNPQIKIITIEDPIEYHLRGISQTQIDDANNYSFDAGLRAVLRQDPDIVMMGELRNADSAHPAMQASLAGKRIFTTLHTNDAGGAVPRLEDMGIANDTIAAGLATVIAQRLIRKLCDICKVEQKTTEQQKEAFSTLLHKVPHELLSNCNFDAIYTSTQSDCSECQGKGFEGMMGLFEMFGNTPNLTQAINRGIPEESFTKILIDDGMITMKQDASIRILQGETSIPEVERVLGIFLPNTA